MLVTAVRGIALAVAIVLAVGAGSAAAAPRLAPAARAGRIQVVAEPGLDALAGQLASSAEAELGRIAADLASVAPAGRGAPAWAIGVAYPDLGVVSVATRRGAELADPQATLRQRRYGSRA